MYRWAQVVLLSGYSYTPQGQASTDASTLAISREVKNPALRDNKGCDWQHDVLASLPEIHTQPVEAMYYCTAGENYTVQERTDRGLQTLVRVFMHPSNKLRYGRQASLKRVIQSSQLRKAVYSTQYPQPYTAEIRGSSGVFLFGQILANLSVIWH